jgi:hypothetical protein
MGIFDKLKESIFGHHNALRAAPAGPPSAGCGRRWVLRTAPAPAAHRGARRATMPVVDVEAMLEAKAAKAYSHTVNWRESIVDLMAIVGIDNSLAERRALARASSATRAT